MYSSTKNVIQVICFYIIFMKSYAQNNYQNKNKMYERKYSKPPEAYVYQGQSNSYEKPYGFNDQRFIGEYSQPRNMRHYKHRRYQQSLYTKPGRYGIYTQPPTTPFRGIKGFKGRQNYRKHVPINPVSYHNPYIKSGYDRDITIISRRQQKKRQPFKNVNITYANAVEKKAKNTISYKRTMTAASEKISQYQNNLRQANKQEHLMQNQHKRPQALVSYVNSSSMKQVQNALRQLVESDMPDSENLPTQNTQNNVQNSEPTSLQPSQTASQNELQNSESFYTEPQNSNPSNLDPFTPKSTDPELTNPVTPELITPEPPTAWTIPETLHSEPDNSASPTPEPLNLKPTNPQPQQPDSTPDPLDLESPNPGPPNPDAYPEPPNPITPQPEEPDNSLGLDTMLDYSTPDYGLISGWHELGLSLGADVNDSLYQMFTIRSTGKLHFDINQFTDKPTIRVSTTDSTLLIHLDIDSIMTEMNNPGSGRGPFSVFASQMCKMLVTKEPDALRRLAVATEPIVVKYTEDELAYVDHNILIVLSHFVQRLAVAPTSALQDLARQCYWAYSNHSFMSNYTRVVVEELDQIYQPEDFIHALAYVHYYPIYRNATAHDVVKIVVDNVLKGFNNRVHSDYRKEKMLSLINKAITENRLSRRYLYTRNSREIHNNKHHFKDETNRPRIMNQKQSYIKQNEYQYRIIVKEKYYIPDNISKYRNKIDTTKRNPFGNEVTKKDANFGDNDEKHKLSRNRDDVTKDELNRNNFNIKNLNNKDNDRNGKRTSKKVNKIDYQRGINYKIIKYKHSTREYSTKYNQRNKMNWLSYETRHDEDPGDNIEQSTNKNIYHRVQYVYEIRDRKRKFTGSRTTHKTDYKNEYNPVIYDKNSEKHINYDVLKNISEKLKYTMKQKNSNNFTNKAKLYTNSKRDKKITSKGSYEINLHHLEDMYKRINYINKYQKMDEEPLSSIENNENLTWNHYQLSRSTTKHFIHPRYSIKSRQSLENKIKYGYTESKEHSGIYQNYYLGTRQKRYEKNKRLTTK